MFLTMFSDCHGVACPSIDHLGCSVVGGVKGFQESWDWFVPRFIVTQAAVAPEAPCEDATLHVQSNLQDKKSS